MAVVHDDDESADAREVPDTRTGRVRRRGVLGSRRRQVVAFAIIAVASIVVLRLTNPRPKKEIAWQRVEDMPAPRGEAAFAMNGLRLIVAGGLYGVGRASNAVDVYDVRQRQWFIRTHRKHALVRAAQRHDFFGWIPVRLVMRATAAMRGHRVSALT